MARPLAQDEHSDLLRGRLEGMMDVMDEKMTGKG
jgi:hypothetical protein